MALFDPSMFDPSTYNGGMNNGLLGYLAQALKYSRGIQPEETPLPNAPISVVGGAGALPVPTFGQPQTTDLSAQPVQPRPQVVPQVPQQQPEAAPNFLQGGGLFGLLGSIASPASKLGIIHSQQQQQLATLNALQQSGVPRAEAIAATLNPDILKAVVSKYIEPKTQFGVVGQNQMGVNQYGFINPSKETVHPAQVPGATAAGGGNIDPSLTGNELLTAISADPQLGPGKAQMIKAIAEGRQPYPSGFLLKTPFGQWLTTMVGQYEPGLDATLVGQRATFNKQMGSATPTSVGGQKTLMGTSLGHLAEVADRALSLNNSGGLGIAPLAHGYNAIKNSAGTEAAANANALNETVDRFSGEVGKLYSGSSGGGVSERESTRARFGASQSPLELASGLEAARDLIKSKLDALENQQNQIFGPDSKNRVDFLGTNGRAALEKIDTAIAKLRSDKTGAPAPSAPTATGPNGQKLILRGNQWVPFQ